VKAVEEEQESQKTKVNANEVQIGKNKEET
jgi:hypothetical protein